MKKTNEIGANVQDEQTTAANGTATVKMPKYMIGMPKQYRFDAKAGQFNINGTIQIKGNSFTFTPLAYRIFADDILQMGAKKWVEFFFVDEKNCVSAILFHGYSLDNLLKLNSELFYDDITLDKVRVTATAVSHTKKLADGKSTTYYVAEFSYEVLTDKEVAEVEEIVSTLHENQQYIYRRDTLTEFADITISHNFYNPGSEPEKIDF